jgi:hypothetical protein
MSPAEHAGCGSVDFGADGQPDLLITSDLPAAARAAAGPHQRRLHIGVPRAWVVNEPRARHI